MLCISAYQLDRIAVNLLSALGNVQDVSDFLLKYMLLGGEAAHLKITRVDESMIVIIPTLQLFPVAYTWSHMFA